MIDEFMTPAAVLCLMVLALLAGLAIGLLVGARRS